MVAYDEEGFYLGKFMRVRVKLDIHQQLYRGMRIVLASQEPF